MDSVATVESYAKIISGNDAYEQGLCLTEHGTMSNAIEVEQIASKYNLKPVHGIEMYLTDDPSDLSKRLHQVVIAKDKIGYEMLVEILNKTIEKKFVFSSRTGRRFAVTPISLLKSITYNNYGHLYAFGACIGGYYNKPIIERQFDLSIQRISDMLECFDLGNVFFEYQLYQGKHAEQTFLNSYLANFGHEEGFSSIITSDSHAATLSDLAYRPILHAMQIKTNYAEYVERYGEEIDISSNYLKSGDQMLSEYAPFDNFGLTLEDMESAIDNTSQIFNQIESYSITKKSFSLYCGDNQLQNFNNLIRSGWQKRVKGKNKSEEKYLKRLEFEISVLKEKKFIPYLLDCHKIISALIKDNIYVGCGRGSGAGSLCNYLLGLTNIDPLEYNLLFERFIDIARPDPPDLDTDISDRDRAIEIIQDIYPDKTVAVIGNKGRMQLKAIINNVLRTLEIKHPKEYYVANTEYYSKLVDKYLLDTDDIDKFFDLDEVKSLIEHAKSVYDIDIKELFSLLHNSLSNFGVHAGGVVLLEKGQKTIPYVPLTGNTYSFGTGFSEGRSIKELSLVGEIKFDFLGLKTLKYIEDCCELVAKNHNLDFNKIKYDWMEFNNIDLNDPKVYELINNLWTDGIFQLGSDGMKRVLELVTPRNLEELAICVALFRPGPLKSGAHINIKKAKVSENYGKSLWEKDVLDQIQEIIKPTYYQLLYEEQIIQIGQKIGGFEPKYANEFRKFLKSGNELITQQPEKYKQQRDKFYKTFLDNGKLLNIKDENVEDLWQKMVVFSSYSFNKSHAIVYAVDTFITAYLSAYYPLEWYTIVLKYEDPKVFIPIIQNQIKERNLNISIKSPQLNKSSNYPTCSGNNIYLGIQLIKGVGNAVAVELGKLNEKQIQFDTFNDFICSKEYEHRLINKNVMETLIDIGYFDSISEDRLQLRFDFYVSQLPNSQKNSRFTIDRYKDNILRLDDFGLYIYQQEMENIGFSHLLHPVFAENWSALQEIKTIVEKQGQELYLIHCIDNVKIKTTKTGKPFYTVTFKPIDSPSLIINVWENQREEYLKQYNYDITKDWSIPLILIVFKNAGGYYNVKSLKPKFPPAN